MKSARLRHWVEIQLPTTTQDESSGAMVISWAPFAQVWAEIAPLSAREFMSADARQAEMGGRITIRHLTGINATMRVVHEGTAYQLVGPPLPDQKSGREYLTLVVSAGVRVA